MNFEIELTGVSPEAIALLFGGPLPSPEPHFTVEASYRKPGAAGLSRTQRRLRRSVVRPRWYWGLVAHRPCWAKAVDGRTLLHNAKVVI